MALNILGYAIIQLPELLPSLYDYVLHGIFGKSSMNHKKVKPRSLQQNNRFMFKANDVDDAKLPNLSKRLLKLEMQNNSLMDEIRDLKLKHSG